MKLTTLILAIIPVVASACTRNGDCTGGSGGWAQFRQQSFWSSESEPAVLTQLSSCATGFRETSTIEVLFMALDATGDATDVVSMASSYRDSRGVVNGLCPHGSASYKPHEAAMIESKFRCTIWPPMRIVEVNSRS
ncbi:hypothetical protein V495_06811 [Pseudogymnoascus sp. VKM F-4514 (FW-929)]|nr:hypothetical protein V495_06811 [Pseudogymnoascus sp. VKM F-4514 (FW-929)]